MLAFKKITIPSVIETEQHRPDLTHKKTINKIALTSDTMLEIRQTDPTITNIEHVKEHINKKRIIIEVSIEDTIK